MDIHDLFAQVISELDVYEEVGSNNALILSVCTSTTDGTLSITFEGLTGSPTISAISIHSALPPSECHEPLFSFVLLANVDTNVGFLIVSLQFFILCEEVSYVSLSLHILLLLQQVARDFLGIPLW